MPGLTTYIELYTPEETRILNPFFTNTDSNVFALRNTLPERVKGALTARYSRSISSMRRLFLDEFLRPSAKEPFPENLPRRIELLEELAALGDIGGKRADDLYRKVLAQYGDDSVLDSTSATVAIEGVDQIDTKEVEDNRLAGYIEKSTRYNDFTVPVRVDSHGYVLGRSTDGSGRFLYREYDEVQGSAIGSLYSSTMDLLFQTVKALQGPVADVVRKDTPLDDQTFMVKVGDKSVNVKFSKICTLQGISVEEEEGKAKRAYEAAVKAKTFDLTRGPFPASIMTNFAWHGSFRTLDHGERKMFASRYPQSVITGQQIFDELSKIENALIAGVKDEHGLEEIALLRSQRESLVSLARATSKGITPRSGESVTFVSGEDPTHAQEVIAAATLFPGSNLSFKQLMTLVSINPELGLKTIEAAVEGRTNRRHKPPRSFETQQVTMEFIGNFGIYRDLQRNRFTLQVRQDLTTLHGYDLPRAVVEAGMESRFRDAMEASDTLYHAMLERTPAYAELATTFAHKMRWIGTFNMRQAAHFFALRTIPEGHPDYRKVMQHGAEILFSVYPPIAHATLKFVNKDQHALERLASAYRTETKLAELDKAGENT